MIQVDFDENIVRQARQAMAYAPRQVNIAAAKAVNRTLTHVRKEISVEVRQHYYVKAATVKASLTMKRVRSTAMGIGGGVLSEGTPLHLAAFNVRHAKRGPMSAAVKIGGGKMVPGLFQSRSKGLLKRVAASRYPLKVPYGPSVPQMVGSPIVLQIIAADAEAVLNDNFSHEIAYRMEAGMG